MSKPRLRAIKGPLQGHVFEVKTFPFRLGRNPEADIVLPDLMTSRYHAEIISRDGKYFLVDQNSRNGVRLNGEPVIQAQLTGPAKIEVGESIFIFDQGETQSPMAPMDARPSPQAHAYRPSWLPMIMPLIQQNLSPRDVASQCLEWLFTRYLGKHGQIHWQETPPFAACLSQEHGSQAKRRDIPLAWLAALEQNNPLVLPQDRMVLVRYQSPHLHDGLFLLETTKLLTSEDILLLSAEALTVFDLIEKQRLYLQDRRLRTNLEQIAKFVPTDLLGQLESESTQLERLALEVVQTEVTVLFSDIVGFTSLSEQWSAAEIAQLVNGYFQRMVNVVTAHHGEVNKFIGDAIMALFGVPKSFGLDPVNATRAGLHMIEVLHQYCQEIDQNKRFSIRIGINTGTAVVGNIGAYERMEYTALGDVVNLASRLEGLSEPNTVTVGAKTAELIRSHFELEQLKATHVKGKHEMIRAFKVLHPK